MKKILIAGATGYLGRYLVKELKANHTQFLALGRNAKKLRALGLQADEMAIGEVTSPSTLKGVMDQVETVISTVGITRQKDGLSYMDVDYQANVNLLRLAQAAGVKKFVYVSVINGDKMRELKIMEAKEMFVDELKASGLDYTIVRPNGFFSDMKDFLEMAKGGKVYLFGDGEFKLNPIHGQDLAKVIVESLDSNRKEMEIGGPDVLTQNEIAAMALDAVQRPRKILHLPDWTRKAVIGLMRTFTSGKTYGPVEFFMTMMAQDNIAPRYGIHRLRTFFNEEVDQIQEFA